MLVNHGLIHSFLILTGTTYIENGTVYSVLGPSTSINILVRVAIAVKKSPRTRSTLKRKG